MELRVNRSSWRCVVKRSEFWYLTLTFSLTALCRLHCLFQVQSGLLISCCHIVDGMYENLFFKQRLVIFRSKHLSKSLIKTQLVHRDFRIVFCLDLPYQYSFDNRPQDSQISQYIVSSRWMHFHLQCRERLDMNLWRVWRVNIPINARYKYASSSVEALKNLLWSTALCSQLILQCVGIFYVKTLFCCIYCCRPISKFCDQFEMICCD